MKSVTESQMTAAIKAAGLDPSNPTDAKKFETVFMSLLNGMPDAKKNRLTGADINHLLTEASNKIHGEDGIAKLKEQGRGNDASSLFNLTGMSGKRRNALRQASESSDYLMASPPPHKPFVPTGNENPELKGPEPQQPKPNLKGATYIDLHDLFKQARKEGKI